MDNIIGSTDSFCERNEGGVSLVELALSLSVILLLLVGAVDFAMAYFSFTAMQDAAREGALYGANNPKDEAGIVMHVRSASSNPVDLADKTLVDVIVSLPGDACVRNEVRVDVIYDYPISMPFIGAIARSEHIRLVASATDTILQPTCSD
jgi:hypothetical protein